MSSRAHRSIGEVLEVITDEFPDVTISKIRFLETQGLIDPQRTPSGYRKFFEADVARLRWILVQQRDHFLPLRVIKERLDRGDWSADEVGPAADRPPARERTNDGVAADDAAPAESALDIGATDARFTLEELANAASLEVADVRELEKVGLIEPVGTEPVPTYLGEAVIVARAARGFMQHGLEPRHLRAWKVAAERESGLIEQIVVPISRQGASGSKKRAVDVAHELAGLANDLRQALVSQNLRSALSLD